MTKMSSFTIDAILRKQQGVEDDGRVRDDLRRIDEEKPECDPGKLIRE